MRGFYRLLLLLLPPGFRRRYEAELLDAFDAERAKALHGGLGRRLSLWRHLLGDLFVVAARQRYRTAADRIADLTGGGVPRLPPQPGRSVMESLVQDIRYALRQFARRPGFTAVAVLSLVLGIGGNTVIYGLLDGLVFNPFPYPAADRLVAIGAAFPKLSSEVSYIEVLSPAEYRDIRSVRSFARVGAFDLGSRNVSGGDVPERVFTAFLLEDLFPVIGMAPQLGRGFTRDELGPNGPRAAIISHRLWQTRFGGDPRILERGIRIGGEATAVVGIMPPGLVLMGADMWLPWGGDPNDVPRGARQFTLLARLADGVSHAQANAELATLAAQVHQAHGGTLKEYDGWRLVATPWAAALLEDLRPAAFMLLVAVGLVLLIACANLANLMLARATTRSRELAVRLALGAGRLRIARQLLTESLLLALIGAVGGVALAYVGLQFAGAVVPAQFAPLGLEAGVSLRVLAWSAAAAVAAGVLVAILPMIQATRTDPQESLKSETRSGVSRSGARVRHALIVVEIALSVVLLLGAALLMRSFANLQRADLGYNPRGVLAMRLTLPLPKYDAKSGTAFFEELTRRASLLPGVTASAMVSQRPPGAGINTPIEVEGSNTPASSLSSAAVSVASREYFKAVQGPVLRGRAFDATDTPQAPPRIVVNQAFATQFFKDRDPLTARVRVVGGGDPGPWSEVVGVVGNARNTGAAAPVRPEIFLPMEQGRHGWNQLYLLMRSEGDPTLLLPEVRAVLREIDPEQPVYNIQTLEETLAVSTFQRRISMVLLGIFAAVALVLSAIGIYGVMSYSVSARTQEIGVRMAIGAERSDVVWLVLRQVTRLAGIGLAIGVALLLLAAKGLSGLLYGVTPSDPLTIALVTVTLGAVSLLAAWVPAWKASRINPIQALRYE